MRLNEINSSDKAREHMEEFERELTQLINKYGLENLCNTPDFILAHHMYHSLIAFSNTSLRREVWFGQTLSIDSSPNRVTKEEVIEQNKQVLRQQD